MPVKYRDKSATRIFFKLKPVKRVYYKYVQVFLAGWITRAIVTWSLQSRPSKKEVPNPAHATWLEGRPPYVTAYNEANSNYDSWLRQEPTKYEDNPAYTAWLIDKKPYDDKIKECEDKLAQTKSEEPEYESQEWKDWNTEQQRLDSEVNKKVQERDSWVASHPQPPAPEKYENPEWTAWNTEQQRLDSEEASAKQSYESAKSAADKAEQALLDAANAFYIAERAYNDAVSSGAPQSTIDRLKSDMDQKKTAYDNAGDAQGAAADKEAAAEKDYNSKKSAASSHKSTEPDHWIIPDPSPEYKAWVAEWNRLEGNVQSAQNASREHRLSEPNKESRDHFIWSQIVIAEESFLERAKGELQTWLSNHPQPPRQVVTQAWYDWDYEKTRLYNVREQKRRDLADYDSKEPSKIIWVPITLYKCKLSASLTGTPPAGATSSDTVTVSLSAGKYKAAVALSMSIMSGSATSAHESEDKPETATLSLTSYEGKQSTSIGEGTWTSNTLNFRLD